MAVRHRVQGAESPGSRVAGSGAVAPRPEQTTPTPSLGHQSIPWLTSSDIILAFKKEESQITGVGNNLNQQLERGVPGVAKATPWRFD